MGPSRVVPSWWADVRRAIVCAVGVAVGCTLLLLVASTGLLRHRRGAGDIVAADGTWAGILAGIGAVAWAFMQISTSRPDTGYRHRGLPGLLALVVFVATLVNLTAMMLWPLIVEGHAAPDELVVTLLAGPRPLVLAAVYVLAMHAWSVVCVLGFIRGGWQSSLAIVPVFLALIGVGGWRGAAIFSSPPSVTSLMVWAVLAVAGLGVLLLVARFTSHPAESKVRPG